MSLSPQPSPPTPQSSTADGFRALLPRFLHPVALLALMWVIRTVDFILPGTFNVFGIRSWDPTSALGIVAGPLLHSGWGHLISNTGPFLVLGLIVAAEGVRRFWIVTAVIAVVGGAGTWLVNLPGTLTVGASGLVFGYFAYIVVRAIVVRSMAHRIGYSIVAVIVLLGYGGSMLVGVLPIHEGISWQGHLFGAAGGAVAAWMLGRGDNRRMLAAKKAEADRADPYGLRELGL